MKHFNLITTFIVLSTIASLSMAADDKAASEQKVPAQGSGFQPVEAGKDEKSQTIRFTMAQPDQDGEPVEVEYQVDPKQMNDIPQLREELLAKQEEVKEFTRHVNFLRVQMNLPADMPDENVMALFQFANKDAQKELEKQYQQKSYSTGKLFKESFKQTFSMSPHGFASQTVLFGIAQGAVIYSICLKEYAYNPTCMEQLIQGLKDPIGQIAFSSFILANGFTSSLLTKKYGGVPNKANRGRFDFRPNPSTMRIAIPYIGMSAGMLMSNFTAELLNMMVACGKVLLSQNDQSSVQSLAALAKANGGGKNIKSEDPCNAAQKEFFNFENKVEQYLPMLISMASTTALLTKIPQGTRWVRMKVANSATAEKIAGKVATSETVQFVKGTKLAMQVAAKNRALIKIVAARLAMHVTPAGWILDGMTLAAVGMNILQNAGFIALDHSFLPAINSVWGQLWRAKLVDNVDDKLKEFFEQNQKNGWDRDKNYQDSVKQHKGRSPEATKNIAPVLENFSTQMEAWRMINHSKIFMGLQSWAEITNTLIREMNAAETFYKYYVDRVFEFFKYNEKSKTPEGITGSENTTASFIAFRNYPLYGVKPTGHAECKEGVDADACVSVLELYQTYPAEMEQFQLRTVNEVVNKFEQKVMGTFKPGQLNANTEKEIKRILAELKTNNPGRVGRALYDINMILMTNSISDKGAVMMLALLREAMGDPVPVWEQGIMLPGFYLASMTESKIFENMPDKSSVMGYKFANHIEYLLYQMLCGPDSNKSTEIFKETFGWKPTFNPPRITRVKDATVEWPRAFLLSREAIEAKNRAITELCDPGQPTPFAVLFKSRIYTKDSKDAAPFMEFLGKHLRLDVVGDYTNTNRESVSGFQGFWNEAVKNVLYAFFVRMDTEFQDLLVGMAEALNSEKLSDGFFNGTMKKLFGFGTEIDPAGLLKLTKAGRGLFKSHNQELNVYLTILAEMENMLDPKTYPVRKATFNKDMSLLEQMTMPVYARSPLQKDLVVEMLKVTQAVANMKVINKKAVLAIPMKDFNTAYDNMVTQLALYKDNLDKLKLTPYQKEIVSAAYEHLNKTALSVGVYVFNTQLTNFSAASDYKEFLQNSNRVMESMKPNSKVKQGNSPYAH